MSISLLSTFWVVSFLFVITPGVDWAYAITAGIRGKRVLPAVSGMLLGHLTITILVAAGVGAFVADVPALLTALTIAGSLYMLWLGIGMVSKPSSPNSQTSNSLDSAKQWIYTGFGVSGLNPKALLLILALFPQFFDPQSNWPMSVQMLMLGCIHIISSGIVYLLVGYGSESILKSRPKLSRTISQLSGVAMMFIAALLLVQPLLANT